VGLETDGEECLGCMISCNDGEVRLIFLVNSFWIFLLFWFCKTDNGRVLVSNHNSFELKGGIEKSGVTSDNG
jgi:hypothetical protein